MSKGGQHRTRVLESIDGATDADAIATLEVHLKKLKKDFPKMSTTKNKSDKVRSIRRNHFMKLLRLLGLKQPEAHKRVFGVQWMCTRQDQHMAKKIKASREQEDEKLEELVGAAPTREVIIERSAVRVVTQNGKVRRALCLWYTRSRVHVDRTQRADRNRPLQLPSCRRRARCTKTRSSR